MLFGKDKDPNKVFTPRASTVNASMYIDRSDLESRLSSLVNGTKHIIVHGESGNGKTWLYKRVLQQGNIPFAVINLSNAVRFNGIAKAISDKILKTRDDSKRLAQVVTQGNLAFTPGGIGAGGGCEWVYEVAERDPLDALLKLIRKSGGRRKGVIVLDNFETILSRAELVEELANILLLLDDEDYAQYDIKICIVGVPVDIRDYISKVQSYQSISNRIIELPEVARLEEQQARSLLDRGFRDELGFQVIDDQAYARILWATDRIAQYLHEYGLEVAICARENGDVVDSSVIDVAESRWFDTSLSAVKEMVERNFNSRETKIGRRNQVIFALGCLRIDDFKYSDVEAVVRSEFPESTDGVELNIIQRLNELESSSHPLVKRTPRGDAYRVINPKAKNAIRVMLKKAGDSVEKVPLIN